MTKKTNAMFIRYGLNRLWLLKNSFRGLLMDKINLDALISKELKNFNLLFILSKFTTFSVFICVMSILNATIAKKNRLYFSLLRKKKSVNFLIQNGWLSYKKITQLLFFHKTIKIKFFTKIFKCSIKKKISGLFIKRILLLKYLLHYILINFKSNKMQGFILLQARFIRQLTYFKLIVNKKSCFNAFKLIKNRRASFSRVKNSAIENFTHLKLIKGLLRYKFVCVQIETLVFYRYSKIFNVFCFNVFNTCFTRIFLLNKNLSDNKKIKSKQTHYILYISLALKQSNLVCVLICKFIKKDKSHFKSLSFLGNFLILFIKSNLFYITGCQLRVAGKLGGKMRKSKFQLKIANPRIQTYKFKIDYSFNYSFTKFGVFGIKLWYIYA